ncbi:ribonuclease Y [Nakamurella sp. YIM 132087]|uniref:Ribonuclease Y n=1 Tax=Nakamurella alba TaxID=2665158 RepID=A0A7K1FUQ1_9ACTN|nr:ribonuclease Y [Nakamurella alba]MTD16554.1 ribonuclease Y [Nakamurella alba]
MPTAVVVVLVVVVLALLVAVLFLVRRKPSATPIDESVLRRLLAETVSQGATASGGSTTAGTDRAGQHARHAVDDTPAGTGPAESAVGTTAPGSDHATAELRAQATEAAAEIRKAAADAAAELRERARADADRQRTDARADADRILGAARAEATELRTHVHAERERMAKEAADALSGERDELARGQRRMRDAVEALHTDQEALAAERRRHGQERDELDRLRAALAAREEEIRAGRTELEQRRTELQEQRDTLAGERTALDADVRRQEQELVRVSGLTVESARTELLAAQEEKVRHDAAVMIRRIESEAESTAKSRARAIVTEAIQRVASDQTSQTVVSVVHLPADEVKGRIIGREGRNIRAFETVTGVNVIIDDTPEAVLLSCFDPVRREIGRVTLQMLIDDGRIHPHRIEEAFERAGDEVDALCRRAAEDALIDVGITDLHPELVKLVGRLKYRTSYGQNVLGHLVETSHIARVMAAELGMDPKVVARGAFLHDIGKALTHEAQGSHAMVGADLARRFGESEEVAHCIEAHHDEVAPSTVEAVLTQAADSCSGGRPGARRESLESYVQRLERIEAIASAKKGVEKVFAMQAGRELRVMVKPETVDDLEAHVLAREVAKQIEEELTYPGQVRVTVIRESRATEIAR